MQGLCCLDVQGAAAMDLVRQFLQQSREDPPTIAEAERDLAAAYAEKDRADRLLGGESRHWDVARMALVDRNILRLAVWELLNGRAPRKVVINEALRLAKEFASAESARFVNGVLDAAAKRIDAAGTDAEKLSTDSEKLGRDAGDTRDETT